MKITFLAITLALTGCSISYAQTVSAPLDNQHPYDFATSYCKDRGGLARYTVLGDVVKFSCANNLTHVIEIANR